VLTTITMCVDRLLRRQLVQGWLAALYATADRAYSSVYRLPRLMF